MDPICIPHALHDVTIDELEVSVRLYNVLRSLGLTVLGELSSFTPADILRVKNCGKKTLHELMELVGRPT